MIKYKTFRRNSDVVGMVKWLTRRIVAPLCVGSTPTTHPIGVSPSGKATDFDSVIRWFESIYPCHDPLAQSVEHLTFNQGVPRSSRGWITTDKLPRFGEVFCFHKLEKSFGGGHSFTEFHLIENSFGTAKYNDCSEVRCLTIGFLKSIIKTVLA